MKDIIAILRKHQVQPTPQRIIVAQVILSSKTHASANGIWKMVQKSHPTISRATVYNTLNLFVDKKLVKTQIIKEGNVVYDPCVEPHHHFIDEQTGRIYDIPWNALKVIKENWPQDFEVSEYQVVLRGRMKNNESERR
jgi:Fe2+ or Zn2+ uptake regulation protein